MWVRLEKIDPSQGQQRFYVLLTNQSLFGDWCVTREWGRIGSPGTVKVDHYADEATAIEQAARLMASKHRRGYVAEELCAQCS